MIQYVAVVWFLGAVTRLAGIPAANYYNLGNQLYQQNQYCRAEEVYQKSFEKLAPSSHAYYNAGNAAFQQNEFERAAAYYESALDLAPRDEDTWHNLELARRRIESRRAKKGRASGVLPGKKQGQSLSLAGRPREFKPDAADRILEQSRKTEKRLSRFFQPYRRKTRRTSQLEDIFTMPPDRLMQYMQKQTRDSYPFRPGKSRRKPAPSPARDEVDW